MQDKYVGDIGDFSKFILLKKVFDDEKIGLNWYLYRGYENNNDGIYTNYHYDADYGISDILNALACNNERNINSLEKEMKKVFTDIRYFNEPVESEECEIDRADYRQKWFDRFLEQFKEENRTVVFLDPDNGIEVKSVPNIGRKKAGKYVFYDEIEKLLSVDSFETIVIYQHYKRVKNFKQKILDEFSDKLSDNLKNKHVYAISFHKFSARAYLIISKRDLHQKLKTFVNENRDWRFD